MAKKIAIRPHIAESEVLAALHDLENGAPEARGPSKAIVYETADVLTSYPLYDLFPLRKALNILLKQNYFFRFIHYK